MTENVETQKIMAAFLPISIEHAMDLYIEQAVDKPKKSDPAIETQNDDGTSTTSSKITPQNSEKFYKDFDNYLSRLKGCLGQIDILSKIAISCSKNNFFAQDNGDKKKDDNAKHYSMNLAINDIAKRWAQIKESDTNNEVEND